uniref:Putative ovule protein n=1 Tax=Solanum chacoense TaxID=4108 RepID=A0A0V0HH84_SOLCH
MRRASLTEARLRKIHIIIQLFTVDHLISKLASPFLLRFRPVWRVSNQFVAVLLCVPIVTAGFTHKCVFPWWSDTVVRWLTVEIVTTRASVSRVHATSSITSTCSSMAGSSSTVTGACFTTTGSSSTMASASSYDNTFPIVSSQIRTSFVTKKYCSF